MKKILKCEGYKMFEGSMLITPIGSKIAPFIVVGVWLYKPDYQCWYCKGSSYHEEVCTPINEDGSPLE